MAKAKKEKKIPVYKMKNGKLVKVDEVSHEEALKAVECIRGLRGYVGVDIVYSNIPYVIEINARLTTPSIAFEQVYQISSAEMIYKGLFENLELPKTFCRHMIRKEMGKCYHPYVRVGNYSLVISKYEN